MTELRADRPARLVSICGYLGVLGVFQVVEIVTILARWYSTSGQKQVKRFTDPLVEGGFSRGDAETTYRVYLGIVAVLAGSVVVFAVYTAMGHAVSRIMLTITAPLMALFGIGEGAALAILLTIVAFYCASQLWTSDARRWFALVAGKDQPADPSAPLPAQPGAPVPGQIPGQVPGQAGQAYAPPQHYVTPQPVPTDWVKVWSIITLFVSSLIAIGCGIFLVVYAVARDQFVQMEVDSPGNWTHLNEAEIRQSFHDLAILSGAVLPLCLVAIGFSIATLVRRRRSR